MQPLVLATLLLFATATGAGAQTASPIRFHRSGAAAIRELVAEADTVSPRLPDLARADRHSAEIRLWHGCGVTGIDLVRFRRHGGHWTAEHRPVLPGDVAWQLPAPGPDGWDAGIAAALAAGLLSLREAPADTALAGLQLDGWCVLFEWVVDGRHGRAGADDPAFYCTAEDQRLLRVWNALFADAQRCTRKPG
jgi:hypothetical protein